MHFRARQKLIENVSGLVNSLSIDEKRELFEEVLETKNEIPISVFKAKLSGLEIITKYFKEVENKSFKEISEVLNRRLSTLYNTYNNSKTKFRSKLDVSDDSIGIPFDAFFDRKYSILESIVLYLKDDKKLSFNQISLLLNKKYNTIKAVYRRYKLKRLKK